LSGYRTSALFPDAPGCDWCLEVRQAARVQTDEHEDDLELLHASFREWVGRARIEYSELSFVAIAAASEEEARRFEREAERLIAEQDLFLITSLHRRDGPESKWQPVARPEETVSNEEIEAELTPVDERVSDESRRWTLRGRGLP
jgi:hypothetical protein